MRVQQCAAAVVLMLSFGTGLAQEGAAVKLDEIVVEGTKAALVPLTNGPTGVKGYTAEAASAATKTNTPLVEIPQTVSVITRENLTDRNVQTLNEALAYTPGASASVFGFDPRYEDVYIRGFDTIYNGVYRDGLRDLNAPGAGAVFRNEPYGLDAITVIEGPAGATYGYGSPGGIVDLTSKRPVFTRFSEVWLENGTFDRHQGNFDTGAPIAGTNDTMAYRVTGVFRGSQTFPSGPDDRVDIAPALTWRPDAATTFTFLSGYDHSRVPGNASFLNGPNFSVTNFQSRDPAYDKIAQDQYRLGYAFEHRFSADTIVRQNLRYAALDLAWRYSSADAINPDGISASRSNGLLLEREGSFEVDTQLEHRFAIGPTKHTVLAGLDYAHIDFAEQSGFGAIPDLNLINPNYGQNFIPDPALTNAYRQRQDQLGEYLQDQVALGPVFLTLSGRHDTVTTGTVTDASPANGTAASTLLQKDDAFTGRAGINVRVAPGLYPYASYATTFAPNLGTSITGQPFQAQRGDQKEVGLKYNLPRTNVQFAAAYFDIDESSVIRTDPDNLSFSAATGAVRSRGYEVSVVDNIAPGTNLTASFTHFDLRFAENTVDTDGKQLSGIPGTSAKAFIVYKIPVAGPLGGLSLGGGVQHLGYSWADDTNTVINKPVTLFDAVGTYDFGALSSSMRGVRAQINAYNVFDTYSTTCQAGFCYRRSPLQVIGTLMYRW